MMALRSPLTCAASRAVAAPRRIQGLRAARLVVRAEQQKDAAPEAPAAPELAPVAVPVAAAASSSPAPAPQPFSILGAQQEVINGRAAMLGFVVAICTELASGQSVFSQLAGKYVNQDLVEKSLPGSALFYAFTVVTLTLASFAPQVYKGEGPDARSFGPFKPAAELTNGRAAMIGFLALLAVEFVRGNVALF